MRNFAAELEARRAQGLYRERKQTQSPQRPSMQVDGQPLLNFCSNDYLGLASNPHAVAALIEALPSHGIGGGASHLICGHHQSHHALEERLARFTGRDSALFFSTGYMANVGVISALVGKGDTVFSDELNHASIIDGCRLSGARICRFAHSDMSMLEQHLAETSGHKMVVTDGVFSMDGDLAKLGELSRLCRKHDALLLVDDAHGLGVIGRGGRGSVDHFGLDQDDVPLLIGTLGKAFGTAGAFVAGPQLLIDYLVQKARTYIYTTSMPPALAEVTRQTIDTVEKDESRRTHLHTLVDRFRRRAQALGYQVMPSDTPIQPLLIGDAARAMAMSAALEARGIWVSAIRPPTVPPGQSRLRVTFSAAHTHEHLNQLLDALQEIRSDITTESGEQAVGSA